MQNICAVFLLHQLPRHKDQVRAQTQEQLALKVRILCITTRNNKPRQQPHQSLIGNESSNVVGTTANDQESFYTLLAAAAATTSNAATTTAVTNSNVSSQQQSNSLRRSSLAISPHVNKRQRLLNNDQCNLAFMQHSQPTNATAHLLQRHSLMIDANVNLL
ncbi:hypothetical protein BLA29_006512, partial [Euroglyphus maynei]